MEADLATVSRRLIGRHYEIRSSHWSEPPRDESRCWPGVFKAKWILAKRSNVKMFQWLRLLRVEYQWLMCCVNRNHELWCNLNYRLQPSSVVSKTEWNVPGASAVRDSPWGIYFPNQVLTGHFICKYTLSRRYEAGVRSGELYRHTSPSSWLLAMLRPPATIDKAPAASWAPDHCVVIF